MLAVGIYGILSVSGIQVYCKYLLDIWISDVETYLMFGYDIVIYLLMNCRPFCFTAVNLVENGI